MLACVKTIRALRTALACAPLVLLASCGGAPPPPPKAPPAPVEKPVVAEPPAPPPVDLSPVAEPDQLVVLGRLDKPASALRTATGWMQAQLPIPPLGSPQATELLTGDALGGLVDLEQPIDVAAVLTSTQDPDLDWAVAAGVRSMAEAQSLLGANYKFLPGPNGALRIDGLAGSGSDRRVCELAPASGAASTRIVCGGSDEALKKLVPYLTRTAPTASFPGAVHLELRAAPLRGLMRGGIHAMQSLFGRGRTPPQVTEVMRALVGEVVDFSGDIDVLALDASIGDNGLEGTFTARFGDAKSFIARMATAHPERADAPPAPFFRLPGDADVAFFFRGSDPAAYEQPRAMVLRLIDAGLGTAGLAAADRKALVDALGHFPVGLSGVYASGIDAASVRQQAAKKDEVDRTLRESLFGWHIVGIDAPSPRVAGPLKELVQAVNRPAIQKALREKAKGEPLPTVRLVPVPGAAHLPKDTLHVVLSIPGRRDIAPPAPEGKKPAKKAVAPPPPKPYELHLYVVPDGGGSFIGIGLKDDLILQKLRVVLPGSPEASTLARRAGLERFSRERANSGGFLTVAGIGHQATQVRILDYVSPRRIGKTFGQLDALPSHGDTPVPILFNAHAPDGAARAGSFSGTIRLPRSVVQDIADLAIRGGRF